MSHSIAGFKSKTKSDIKNLWITSASAYRDAEILCGAARFDIDVAASESNRKCGRFIDKQENALEQFWFSDYRVRWAWCNPPFDLKREFLDKAYEQRASGNTCLMIPYEPCTKWWRSHVHGKASVVYIPDGRYNYCHPETGEEIKGVAFASCFVVFTSLNMPTQYVHFNRGDL